MKEMRIRKFIYAKACVNENFHLRAIYATCSVEIEFHDREQPSRTP